MSKKFFYPLTIILALLVCYGCSKENRPDDLPQLYPVTLTITMDGQPLENALVNFFAEDKAISKWTVGSITDSHGKAIIVTHGQFRGAPAGKFKVCVRKTEMPDVPTSQDDKEMGNIASFFPGQESGMRGVPVPINHVHADFGKRETTPLEIEVSTSKKMLNLTLDVHKP
ncbi:MAG: Ig-like domain-containing protein [Planctomycetaceae bacterium]|nr:Ig-like domain-containing protein [Planctomycetaceae bacterium]